MIESAVVPGLALTPIHASDLKPGIGVPRTGAVAGVPLAGEALLGPDVVAAGLGAVARELGVVVDQLALGVRINPRFVGTTDTQAEGEHE
jgi:hypothetical protein